MLLPSGLQLQHFDGALYCSTVMLAQQLVLSTHTNSTYIFIGLTRVLQLLLLHARGSGALPLCTQMQQPASMLLHSAQHHQQLTYGSYASLTHTHVPSSLHITCPQPQRGSRGPAPTHCIGRLGWRLARRATSRCTAH